MGRKQGWYSGSSQCPICILIVWRESQNSEFHLGEPSLSLALSCLPGIKEPLEISSQLPLILPRISGWSTFHSKDSQYRSRTSCLKNSKFSGEAPARTVPPPAAEPKRSRGSSGLAVPLGSWILVCSPRYSS